MSRLGARLGRRGGFLLAFGVAWGGIGVDLLTAPAVIPPAVLMHVPLQVWGGVWLACAVVAVVAAWLPHDGEADVAGYVALMIPDAIWLGSYTTRWVTDVNSRYWASAIVWAAVFVALIIAAGWREPASMHSIAVDARHQHGDGDGDS